MAGPCAARKSLHNAGILLRIAPGVKPLRETGLAVSQLEPPKARWEAPSRAFARLFRLIWGDDVDAAMRLSVVAAITGAVACRFVLGRRSVVPEPA